MSDRQSHRKTGADMTCGQPAGAGMSDHLLLVLDLEGRVISWNAVAHNRSGYDAEAVIGAHFSRFYRDEERVAGVPSRLLEEAARHGRSEGEAWRLRSDGSGFRAHSVIDQIRDLAGEPAGYVEIIRDLTGRAQQDETIRRNEQQFTLLVQSVTDYAIYMIDPRGQVSSWNPGAERIKGYCPDEIIGQHFSCFYTDEDRRAGEPQRALETALRDGRFAKEGFRVRKDGSRFWASVVIDPIRDDRGTLLGFAKITRDITERLDAERELDRTREALFQAQKMEAIGQLTGGVAHDFNNLLMVVLSSLGLLRKRLPDDQSMLRLIDNAIAGAERGAALTQRMLAFARRQDLKLESLDLAGLVAGMMDLIQRSLGPSIIIETGFPADLQRARADANQLEMALLNLVVNARDAMPGGGTIRISGEDREIEEEGQDLPPGRYVILRVVDTGAGMDAGTLARALEPFFTTKGVGKGTGLGLPMVHGLAEQSGGRFVIKSDSGTGTTAELWLSAGEAAQGAGAEAPAEQPADQDGRPLTVLAVDDDSLVLMNTTALLEELGHNVIEAYSASEALTLFRQDREIDLVITDQAMPQMTGLELAATIRAERPATPIILATGYGELPAGTDPAIRKLGKPFRQQDLAEAVADAMGARA